MSITMKKLTPNLMVDDVRQTITFYTDMLGCSLRMAVPADKSGVADAMKDGIDYIYAQMACGDIEIMFQEKNSLREDVPAFAEQDVGGSVALYFEVTDIDAVYASLQGKVDVVKDLETAWYGMREFYIRDCNGYILCLAEQAQAE